MKPFTAINHIPFHCIFLLYKPWRYREIAAMPSGLTIFAPFEFPINP
jgi:hypothetical protein